MAQIKPKIICWDASCFCAWFNAEQGRYDICNAIIEAAQKGEIRLMASYLTLAEVGRIPDQYPSEAEDAIAEFFKSRSYIIEVAVDWFVCRIARDLMTRFNLGCRDAIHLATAIHVKADALHTYDYDDLLKLNGRIPGYSLSITEPVFDYQTKLSD